MLHKLIQHKFVKDLPAVRLSASPEDTRIHKVRFISDRIVKSINSLTLLLFFVALIFFNEKILEVFLKLILFV